MSHHFQWVQHTAYKCISILKIEKRYGGRKLAYIATDLWLCKQDSYHHTVNMSLPLTQELNFQRIWTANRFVSCNYFPPFLTTYSAQILFLLPIFRIVIYFELYKYIFIYNIVSHIHRWINIQASYILRAAIHQSKWLFFSVIPCQPKVFLSSIAVQKQPLSCPHV